MFEFIGISLILSRWLADFSVLHTIKAMATYKRGDYVKVEFPDDTTVVGEWMWVRVHYCDDEKQLVFGTLDNRPVNDYRGQIALGSELAISYSRIREHRKASEAY
jgi:hypothetical protein